MFHNLSYIYSPALMEVFRSYEWLPERTVKLMYCFFFVNETFVFVLLY